MSVSRILWRDTFSDGRSCECQVERTDGGAFLVSVRCGDDVVASELLYDEAHVATRAAALHRLFVGAANP